MTAAVGPPARSWRAPERDGEALVDPPLEQLPERIEENRRLHLLIEDRFDGITVPRLRWLARRELLRAADAYTRSYRDIDSAADAEAPLVLSGHQPELVHCGVWFKHFVLGESARRVEGNAVHLLIDNDVAKRTSILVPTGTPEEPRLVAVPFDHPARGVPYEERAVADRATWESFGRRVADTVRPLVPEPLIESLWPRVLSHRQRPLGQALAAGRHQLEANAGLQTREVPLSIVCQGEAFGWFVALLIADAERMVEAYNEVLRTYRRQHHIRNRSQPVPDLYRDADWTELPLWIWSADSPRRRHLFARRSRSTVVLSNRAGIDVTIRSTLERADERAVADLLELHRRGIRIRPRALTTTLFMRWLAGDLFIHGIGGAIYDRVTDQIAHRWWNAPAPHLMVATATCRLPVDRPDVTREDVVRIEHQLRELAFHPEQFVECDADMRRWIDQKRAAIAESLPRGQRKSRHDRIVEANLAMQEPLRSLKERLLAERASLTEQLRRKQRLGSREFSMALFPRTLPEQLRQLASDSH